jgi:type IV secretion system protein VirB1
MISAALLACAINVAPATLTAIIRVESGGNTLALNVNHLSGPQPHAATSEEAASIARRYIALGYSVDLGVMQINNRNLAALHYTIEQALDPCSNVKGGAAILTANYAQAEQQYGEGQRALRAAISAYNTGNFWTGFSNGYVGRVTGIPNIPLPVGAGVRQAVASAPYTAPTAISSPAHPPRADLDPYTAPTEISSWTKQTAAASAYLAPPKRRL